MEDYKHAVRAVRKKLAVLFLSFHLCFHLVELVVRKVSQNRLLQKEEEQGQG